MKTENLTLNEVIEILKQLRLGCYHSFTKKHVEDNGYYFVKRYTGRLCDYENMKSTIEKRKTQPKKSFNGNNNVIVIIPNVLYYFVNTGKYNVSIKTINDGKKHSSTTYYDNNGKEISREEYESINTIKKSNGGGEMFYLNMSELVEVK